MWTLDFQFDSDNQGKAFKICNVIDGFTCEHGDFEFAQLITATVVIDLLENLAAVRGGRSWALGRDNGPEFISHELTQLGSQARHC
ncbi:transposase family protein [Corynebacterium pseudodiphtheriticum]|uniref:integrase catalytic domain-containing protein n=1 Tax=Corynebacterium pseudodiphtheriticum TaxID=37637 RepID=UPI00254BF66F|nr:transposase family protein [Corynebacterium pseudodiphtheriticum]MDK8478648.1 transposase family protein [Corynebacterium pseudodiphtheriticum]MDK8486424.1 transposase family protein [Corynebacterium pseudodiphtheriticum]MDK8493429.1 transposase family protein [Corynebacterium pseudodiphtheriticum]MDK8551109.1 transposase family protein [Corynebacterium pseudodiphtheriticum]MDK8563013.1 transposase family protein [Corynebacterium pseudodiphtheriticum]